MNKKTCCSQISSRKVKERIIKASPIDQFRGLKLESKAKNQMTFLRGGKFLIGTEDEIAHEKDGEKPPRLLQVDPFYIDCYQVTNLDFIFFVKETGYITEAEEYGWSYVFHLLLSEDFREKGWESPPNTPWWAVVEGASWFQPEGPGSQILDRLDDPVVHISYKDAKSYSEWAGKRLPTEAEWEYAASGRLFDSRYPWGNKLHDQGKHHCNIWQGDFPKSNTAEDEYVGTCPVQEYASNDFGLYNVIGNVWEWCSDSFYKGDQSQLVQDWIVTKGGSYLCHDSYCNRYRIAARNPMTKNSTTGNLGFRCAKDK